MWELKERLKKVGCPPEVVLILDSGLLVKADHSNLQRFKALKENRMKRDFDNDWGILEDFLKLHHEVGTVDTDYILLENRNDAINLMYFYTFILDFLKEHKNIRIRIREISVWKKKQ